MPSVVVVVGEVVPVAKRARCCNSRFHLTLFAGRLVSGSPKDAFEIELLRADGLAGGRAGGYLCLSLSLRGGDCDAEEGRGEEENRGKDRRGERRTENGKGRESGASLCWS